MDRPRSAKPPALSVALFVLPSFVSFTLHLFCFAEFRLEWSALMAPRLECIHQLLGDAVQRPTVSHQRKLDWTLDAADVTSPRINWFLPSPHQNSNAPLPGLMVFLEFRLYLVAFAVRVIGHRRYVWFLSMEREPDPMSPHRSCASPRACFCIACHVSSYVVALKRPPAVLRPWSSLRISTASPDWPSTALGPFWVGLKPTPSGFSCALLFS